MICFVIISIKCSAIISRCSLVDLFNRLDFSKKSFYEGSRSRDREKLDWYIRRGGILL